ncbi:MAG: hypothetical protein WAT39_26175 [Planctomycetota bacterium]
MERTGTEYAFMGGLAVTVWGIPRATFDLDLAIGVDNQPASTLLSALQVDDIESDEHFRKGFVDGRNGMAKVAARLLFDGNWFVLDLFLGSTPFLRTVLGRRVRVPYLDSHVYAVSAADLILFKLMAGRRKDWVDIDNVVAVQGVPERPYLEQWAATLGVTDRLRRVLNP